jgi:hypothetical protein
VGIFGKKSLDNWPWPMAKAATATTAVVASNSSRSQEIWSCARGASVRESHLQDLLSRVFSHLVGWASKHRSGLEASVVERLRSESWRFSCRNPDVYSMHFPLIVAFCCSMLHVAVFWWMGERREARRWWNILLRAFIYVIYMCNCLLYICSCFFMYIYLLYIIYIKYFIYT